jgi:hypothetical protein
VTDLSTLVRTAMNQAHTDIDRRGEKVTRVGLVECCDDQNLMCEQYSEYHVAICELRASIIATALADADEVDAKNTAEAVTEERERIKATILTCTKKARQGLDDGEFSSPSDMLTRSPAARPTASPDAEPSATWRSPSSATDQTAQHNNSSRRRY